MPDISSENDLVRSLVMQLVTPYQFASLDLDKKKVFQVVTVTRYLLLNGYAHGIDAVQIAVDVCKKTQIGTAWFLGQKVSQMLAMAMSGRGISSFSKEAESTEVLVFACNKILKEISPEADTENLIGDDKFIGDENFDDNIVIDDEPIAEKRIVACPKCKQKLRIPSGKNLMVTCSSCGQRFEVLPDG